MLRVDPSGRLEQLVGVIEPVDRDRLHAEFDEFIPVQAELLPGHGQGAVRRQDRGRVLRTRRRPLVEHGVEEEVIGARGGEPLGEIDRHLLASDGAVDFQREARHRGGELAEHQRAAVGPQRRQAVRQQFDPGDAEGGFVGLQHRDIECRCKSLNEFGAAGRAGQIFLGADHGAAGRHTEAVEVVRGDRQAERHGEKLRVLFDEAVAEFDAHLFGDRRARSAFAIAEEEDDLLAARLPGERFGNRFEARLEIDGSGGVFGVRQMQHRRVDGFIGGCQKALREGARVLRRVEVQRPDVEPVVGPELLAQGFDDQTRLFHRVARLTRRGVHEHEDIPGPRRRNGQYRLHLPSEDGLAGRVLVSEYRRAAELALGQFVDHLVGVEFCRRRQRLGGRGRPGSNIAEHGRPDDGANGRASENRAQQPEAFDKGHGPGAPG